MKLDRTKELMHRTINKSMPVEALTHILESAIELVNIPDNVFFWSYWEDSEEATKEISILLNMVKSGTLPERAEVGVLFSPTGPLQEISLSSGWSEPFLILVNKYDEIDQLLWSKKERASLVSNPLAKSPITPLTNTIEISKFLSKILRHDPAHIGVEIDEQGWVDIDLLISSACDRGYLISYETLIKVVENSGKQRFALNNIRTRIRANQGHSISLKMNFEEKSPPKVLYHGTSKEACISILDVGILKMSRQYVHLSNGVQLANRVGDRSINPTLLLIDAASMQKDGFTFYISKNGIWLVDHVPPIYISKLQFLNSKAKSNRSKKDYVNQVYPLEIYEECREIEIYEIIYQMERLANDYDYLEPGQCEESEEIGSALKMYSKLLAKLIGEYSEVVLKVFDSPRDEPKYFMSLALIESPTPLAIEVLFEYVDNGIENNYERKIAEEALTACRSLLVKKEQHGKPKDSKGRSIVRMLLSFLKL